MLYTSRVVRIVRTSGGTPGTQRVAVAVHAKSEKRRAWIKVRYTSRVVRNARTNGSSPRSHNGYSVSLRRGQSVEARFGGQSAGPNVSCYAIGRVRAQARLTTHISPPLIPLVSVVLSLCFGWFLSLFWVPSCFCGWLSFCLIVVFR